MALKLYNISTLAAPFDIRHSTFDIRRSTLVILTPNQLPYKARLIVEQVPFDQVIASGQKV